MSFPPRTLCRPAVVLTLLAFSAADQNVAQRAVSSSSTDNPGAVTSGQATPPLASPKHGVETSISLGAAGQLTATRTSDTSAAFQTQSLSPSPGVFATFQQSFKPWLGYSANFTYTRATNRYTANTPAGGLGEIYIPNNIYEVSVSYIARKHLTSRLTALGEAGAGAVGFAAMTRDVSSKGSYYFTVERSNTFQPVGIAGFGIDYRLDHGLALRAEYRGLFVSFPDYASGRPGFPTFTSEPTMSLAYTFGRHSKQK